MDGFGFFLVNVDGNGNGRLDLMEFTEQAPIVDYLQKFLAYA